MLGNNVDVYGYTDVKFLIDSPEYQGLPSDGRPTRSGIVRIGVFTVLLRSYV